MFPTEEITLMGDVLCSLRYTIILKKCLLYYKTVIK